MVSLFKRASTSMSVTRYM